jgi:hypothetical protein
MCNLELLTLALNKQTDGLNETEHVGSAGKDHGFPSFTVEEQAASRGIHSHISAKRATNEQSQEPFPCGWKGRGATNLLTDSVYPAKGRVYGSTRS